jgi:hypothetical protein
MQIYCLVYWLDDRGILVHFSAGDFSLLQKVETGCGTHEAPVQWKSGINKQRHEDENVWSYISTPTPAYAIIACVEDFACVLCRKNISSTLVENIDFITMSTCSVYGI